MLRHSFLIIFRNIKRNKSSFFINLVGLSTGLACALFIYLWVNDELSIDKFHKKDSRLYQVMANFESPQGIQTKKITPIIMADAIAEEFPEVEYAVATNAFLFYVKEGLFINGDDQLKAKGMFASEDFFNVFSYNLIQGDINTALINKNKIVISESLAKRIFNTTENIVGKTIEWDHPYFDGVFQVSGIFEDTPANSTNQFDVVFNIENLMENDAFARGWGAFYSETCLLLKEGTNVEQLNKKIAGYLKSKDNSNESVTIFLQQFSDKYLYGNYENGVISGGRIAYVKLFSVIAVLILLIACINFMNLSTAKASTRIKEIGIKKTIGAKRKSLIAQYLLESLAITFLSLLVAFIIIELLLPQFNAITQKEISINYNFTFILTVLSITVFTGLLSGSYPALYLSRLNPVRVLKGKLKMSFAEIFVRKGLVVFQFALSIIFIVSVFVVNKQIEFTQTKNLGYDRDNILCFQWKQPFNSDQAGNRFETFILEVKNIPGVVNAANMGGSILKEFPGQTGCSWSEQESDKSYLFKAPFVSYDFIETLGLKIIEGRSFSRDFNNSNEEFNILLNEAAVKMMGLDDPINMQIRFDMNIIGVVKDFNYGSLHASIEPLILRFRRFNENVLVKIKAGTEKNTIDKLEKIYKKFNTGQPFEFTFMDDDYQVLYDSEIRTGKLSKYFAGFAIIISCLGLFGLASFTAQKRRKEIGVRRVLGSSEIGIIYLLSTDFIKLIVLSIIIAIPLSYFITKNWLEGFAYRIDVTWWMFVLSGAIALAIALATVSFQAIKAATANPVEALRNE
jgi:ABC-type antimicrobial peptide transport system permease subunit